MREEEKLVKALRRGELSALEELLDRYTPYVSSVIARILRGRQADVEELTADVFLAAWDNRAKLQPGKVKGYLGAIARNRAFNLLRASRESLSLEDDVLLLETEGPDRALDKKETARVVNQALSQLDKPPAGAVRAALLLRSDGAGSGAGHGPEPVHCQDLAAPGAGDIEKHFD